MTGLENGFLLENGKYRVEKVIGRGGFGITYLGEQVSLGRKVAIKEFFMKEYCSRDNGTSRVYTHSQVNTDLVECFRVKFIKEARNLARFRHSNIVLVIDVFEENGTAYYVMEYHPGGSLAEKVKAGPLAEADAVKYIRQVASALEYIHSMQIMHLDVKPANILLDSAGDAVLIDFGLAKQYGTDGHQTSTTPVGLSHGYAPMEQYKSGGVSEFSPVSDIYSLGATLYKLVTGLTPPDANDVFDSGLPKLPASLSAGVRSAIEKAMQPRRMARPQNIGGFLALLDGASVPDNHFDGEIIVVEDIEEPKKHVRSVNSQKKPARVAPTPAVMPVAPKKRTAPPVNKEETQRRAAMKEIVNRKEDGETSGCFKSMAVWGALAYAAYLALKNLSYWWPF